MRSSTRCSSPTATTLDLELLPRSITEAAPVVRERKQRKTPASLRDEWLAPFENRYLTELLAESNGSVRRAAAEAGVDAVTLYRLLRKRQV